MDKKIERFLEAANPVDEVPRRDVLAAMMAAGTTAALSGVAHAQASAVAGAASGGGAPQAGLMPWTHYIDLLRPAGDLNSITWQPDSDQLRAELYRQLLMNLTLGYFIYFQLDPRYPDWTPFLNSVFMLQPNPDDTYYLAKLDGQGIYRITGERGSVRILTFALGHEPMGASERIGGGLAQYDVDDLQLDKDGCFEVILSARRPEGYQGDWWPLPAQAQTILGRQRSYDWGRERDARFAIERLDVTPLKPRMSVEEIDQKLREVLGGYTARLSRIWLQYQNKVRDSGLINRIETTSFSGAQPVQVYWQGVYQFAADEALILETEIPKQNRYWNVQVNDELWNAVEFIHRQSSLNGHQARLDADGRFRAVLSLQDPGVPNWLDTGGYLQGMLIGRWYAADSTPIPTLKRVPFAALREHLPADTPSITPEQRTEVLRARRIGGQLRRRW